MKYSIITPSKDRPDLLQQCLDSLTTHCRGQNYETIVIETGQACASALIHLPGATFAQACNHGARLAKGKYLLLFNNDLIIQNDIIAAFDAALSRHRDPCIIGSKLLYPDGLVQHAGVGFDNDGNPYNLWRLAPSEHPVVNWRRLVCAVTFACALIPRSMWQELDGLDENYHNAFEDVDICLRAREAGYSVVYDPCVTAVHLECQTAGRHGKDAESLAYYRTKWLPQGRIYSTVGAWPFSLEAAR